MYCSLYYLALFIEFVSKTTKNTRMNSSKVPPEPKGASYPGYQDTALSAAAITTAKFCLALLIEVIEGTLSQGCHVLSIFVTCI